jgi:hypothetical protein
MGEISDAAEVPVTDADATPEALPASRDAGRDGSESAAGIEPLHLEALVSAMQPQMLSDRQYPPQTVRASISPQHSIATVGGRRTRPGGARDQPHRVGEWLRT